MNHDKFKQFLILDYYNELKSNEKKELNSHLLECSNCKKEYELLRNDLAKIPNDLSSENIDKLLKEARKNLKSTLLLQDTKLSNKFNLNDLISFFTFPKFQFAIGGLALFVIGFLFSSMVINKTSTKSFQPNITQGKFSLNDNNMRLKNISYINSNPKTGEIQVNFEAVRSITLKGNIKDKNIQNILMYSMLEEKNPGIRLNTINFIKSKKDKQFDIEVKQAIITVVKYDKNPGVRMEAIKVLNTIHFDKDVKDALLYVLMNDKNSAMRISAINKLAVAKNKGLLLQDKDLNQLKSRLKTDKNNYVKLRVKQILKEI